MTLYTNPDIDRYNILSKGRLRIGAHGTSLPHLATQACHHILQDVLLPSVQDPAHPASNLLSDDGQVSGWHTPRCEHALTLSDLRSPSYSICLQGLNSPSKGMRRYCQWPQELMLRLEGPADLHQIQMLSHEYKVPPASMMRHHSTPNL